MAITPWRANGLIVENCNCQLLCPGHVSFKQRCTNERCRGHWAIHVDDGRFADIDLAGTNVLIVFDAPPRMFDGGWTMACYVDERATALQRAALDDIVSGRAGGPWAILARFIETRLETQFVPMQFTDNGREKRLTIPDRFDSTVSAIRGADASAEVLIENLHNVLHGPTHVLARGRTRCTDRVFDFGHTRTHALYSRFSWTSGP